MADEAQYSAMGIEAPNIRGNEDLFTILPPDHKSEVESLEKYIGQPLQHGMEIIADLSEMQSIFPQSRNRSRNFQPFAKFLKSQMGIDLKIQSRRPSKKEYETQTLKTNNDEQV